MPPRRIGLNALFLDPEVSGGPETYLRGPVPALRGLHPDVRFSVVTTRRGAPSLRAAAWPDVLALPVDEGQRRRRLAAKQIALPVLSRRARFDVFHSLASVAPVACPVSHAITVHDVTFLRDAHLRLVDDDGNAGDCLYRRPEGRRPDHRHGGGPRPTSVGPSASMPRASRSSTTDPVVGLDGERAGEEDLRARMTFHVKRSSCSVWGRSDRRRRRDRGPRSAQPALGVFAGVVDHPG